MIVLVGAMSLVAIGLLFALEPMLRGWGIVGIQSFLLVVCVGDLVLVPLTVAHSFAIAKNYSKAQANVPWLTATMFTLPPAIGIVLILRSHDGDPPVALALGCALAGWMWVAAFRQAGRYRKSNRRRRMSLHDRRLAHDMIADCRATLQDPTLGERERVDVELNLAGALVLASLGEGPSELPEATAVLERTMQRSPERTYEAAFSLVDAMGVRVVRNGDFDGSERALALLEGAAGSSEDPDACGIALGARARLAVLRLQEAVVDSDRARCEQLYAAALVDQRRALEGTRPESAMAASHSISLAWMSTVLAIGTEVSAAKDADLDAAVKTVRRALRRLWRLGCRAERVQGQIMLIDMLTLRSQLDPLGPIGGFLESLWPTRPKHGIVNVLWWERSTHDLLRAAYMCMWLSLRGGELAPEARARIPDLTQLMRTGQMSFMRGPAGRVGWMYSRTFREQSRFAPSRSVEVAEQWARWATEERDVRRAGDAYWSWINAVVAQSRRRVFHEDKERPLSQVQGLVAEAGAGLLAAGRPRDAAVAMEIGRAILLTERVQRDRAGLEQRLRAAGRADLADRWCEAAHRMAHIDRTTFGPRVEPEAIEVGFASAEFVAHAEYERVLHEIADLVGFEDVEASPTYDDLRSAACEGPIVYLSATETGGSAVIVTSGPDPVVVELAGLRRHEVDERAAVLLRAADPYEVGDAITPQVDWLWEVVLAPLVEHLPPASLVTLICVGALSQLPIHAAGAGRGADGGSDLVFRYAPNARVLLHAQAAGSGEQDGPVLSVAVADAADAVWLPRVDDESRGVAALFSERGAIRPSPPTIANVTVALDRCVIWHFACHGAHVPDEPLDSHLLLADGPLTLRAMFARPFARRRLAVLSACHTAMPATTRLDEVVNFPSALLQSGVSGVVSAQVAVDDDAATLLVLGFFERVRDGMQPARALCAAQAWLRSATNGELHDAFPDAYDVPSGLAGRALEQWREQQPFGTANNWAPFCYWGL